MSAPSVPMGYQPPPPPRPAEAGTSWVALTIGGAVLLFVVVALAWVLSGDDDEETIDAPAPTAESTATEKPGDPSSNDIQRTSEDPVVSPVSPARPLPGRTTPALPAPAPPPPESPAPPAPQVTPSPAPAPAPAPEPAPRAQPAPAPEPGGKGHSKGKEKGF